MGDRISDLAAIIRTLGYASCAIVYLYRVWTPTKWRWANMATALQYFAAIIIALATIVKPELVIDLRLYFLTPLIVFAAGTSLYQAIHDVRSKP